MEAYPSTADDTFAQAQEQFTNLMDELRSDRRAAATHDEIESLIDTDGREVMRQLYQAYLDLRTLEEERASVTGADGVRRTHRRATGRDHLTVFGETRLRRLSLSLPGIVALFPLEAELNLYDDKYSDGLRRHVAREVAQLAYGPAVVNIAAYTGVTLPKRQVEEIAVRSAQDFDAFYETRAVVGRESTANPLILTFDGKGVIVRHEALRPATKKAAEEAANDQNGGGRRNRKRMAMVASVYTIEPWLRQPEHIVSALRGNVVTFPPLPPRPRPENKRVWASIIKAPTEVIASAFVEALGRDPEQLRLWAVLVDGDLAQIANIKAEAARLGVAVTLIADLLHVLGYLWRAAWCFHERGSEDATDWVLKRLDALLTGKKASNLAAGMRRSATLRKLDADAREDVDKCAKYLINHKEMLHYDQYLARGLPIATGVIEGACRHLVQDRMEITGARWGLDGAEAVLRLRALRCSDDFDDYWAFHRTQEFRRNHLLNYAPGVFDSHPLALVA